MYSKEEVKGSTRDLSPTDRERAIEFDQNDKNENIITYKMLLASGKVPRQIFIHGYQAMYSAAALFLARKFDIKIDEHIGGTHKNMREVLAFYTNENKYHKKLLDLYQYAVDKYNSLSQQYFSEHRFADRLVRDLMYRGYDEGKKTMYYNEVMPGKKDPLELDISDAKEFIEEVVEPFLDIMEEISK